MASGHVNRIQKAEHMAAPTNAANVKKALANSEPSTHGTKRTSRDVRSAVAIRGKADVFCSDGALPGLTHLGHGPEGRHRAPLAFRRSAGLPAAPRFRTIQVRP